MLFKEVRGKLEELLAAKIRSPGLDVYRQGAAVIAAIAELLTSEPRSTF